MVEEEEEEEEGRVLRVWAQRLMKSIAERKMVFWRLVECENHFKPLFESFVLMK